MSRNPLSIVPIALALFAASSTDVLACAVCYGGGDSEMVKSVEAGVIFLALVIYALLSLVGMVLVSWFIRARKLEAAEAAEALAAATQADSASASSPA